MHLRSVPSMTAPPTSSVRGVNGAVATADQLATNAGIGVLAGGGNAVDAAIATNAVMAVVAPHLCGMGGDLFALVHRDGEVAALNASGRAGSGADADELRADGQTEMPFHHDIRSVTVPGCVDGWIALHARFGSRPLTDLLAPAIRLAESGFPASPLLVGASARSTTEATAAARRRWQVPRRTGARVARSGRGAALRAIVADGRAGFYEGRVRRGPARRSAAASTAPTTSPDPRPTGSSRSSTTAFGVDLHTIPPNSQGYLTLGGLRLAEPVGLPDDPDDPRVGARADRVRHRRRLRPARACCTSTADGRALLDAIDGRGATRRPRQPRRRRRHRRPPATPPTCAPSTATAWACR